MIKRVIIPITILVFALLQACVPLKQFQDVKEKNKELSADLRRTEKKNEDLKVSNTELKSMVQRLNRMVEDLKKENSDKNRSYLSMKQKLDELEKRYTDLLNQYQQSSGDSDEARELLAYLQTLQEELQQREDALRVAEQELDEKKKNLELTIANLEKTKEELIQNQIELEQRNARLIELENILASKDSAMNALRNAVADALTGFSSDELEVHVKNGKVYVSMEEKLLFQSGSYNVSQLGVSALKKLAVVLQSKEDIHIMVEGHTDDVPYQSGKLLDNWDLSVKRATSVVRILLTGTTINPVRISATGRSAFLPIEDAKTPEARRKNRRTEIILTPELDKLLNILETN